MIRMILIALVILTGSGCFPSYTVISPEFKTGKTFTAGATQSASVGESILKTYSYWQYDALENDSIITIPRVWLVNIDPIPAKTQCTIIGKLETGMYCCSPTPPVYNKFGIQPHAVYLVSTPEHDIVGVMSPANLGMILNGELFSGIKMNPVKQITDQASNIKELVYNGKDANSIKLMYREYSGSIARPAFYQDLKYDLSESNIIGFRGVSMQVLSATNSKIEFIVLDGGSLDEKNINH